MDAEAAVLGCILIDNKTIVSAGRFVLQEDFKETANAIIWKTMNAMYDRGTAIDILTLSSELTTVNLLQRIGGPHRIVELAESVPTASNAEHYASCVKNESIKRKLRIAGMQIQKHAETKEAEEAVELSQKEVSSVAKRATKTKLVSLGDAMIMSHKEIVKVHEAGSRITGISTGFTALNELLAGFHKKQLILVAGRPSMGKTALAINFGLTASKSGAGVLFFSLEMDAEQVGQRVLAQEAGVNLQDMRRANCDDDDWVKLTKAANNGLQQPFTIVEEEPGLSISQLRTITRDYASKNEVKMVIVDYIQLMRSPGAERREREVAEISAGLKAMAKELSICVLGLSQLNRGLESRPNKRPNLGDLRESGGLEQDADVVMFVYRDEKYNPDTPDKGIAELIISKQRQGPCGTAKVGFNAEETRFMDEYERTISYNSPRKDSPGRFSPPLPQDPQWRG